MFTEKDINLINDIAISAGEILEKKFSNSDYKTFTKKDKSKVTDADLESNQYIVTNLQKLFSQKTIVSEENDLKENLSNAKDGNYFLIDPLDGTDAFIKKKKEWTVNIAYIKNYQVVFGVIYVPMLKKLYYCDKNKKARLNGRLIKVSNKKNDLKILCTKRKQEQAIILQELKNKDIKELIFTSSSYKFCLIAEGKADLYPRRFSISSWDIAAGHSIIKSAGGNVLGIDKKELQYKFDKDFSMPFFNAR